MSLMTESRRSHEPVHLHPDMINDDSVTPISLDQRSIVMIDSRALGRECLARSIASQKTGLNILAFASVAEWEAQRNGRQPVSAILFNIGGRKITEPAAAEELSKMTATYQGTPVIVLSDNDELPQILKALECGARGYIPSSVNIGVCIEAIGLALAGGVFVPASSVLAMHKFLESGMETVRPMAGMFTLRQAEVVEALRRGKANKIIAYELNLRESTVKVHIRNIMKKLKATNRTEVAFKINDLFPAV